jgi:hypothetical protein
MTDDETTTDKYLQACDLAEEVFLPSYALVLQDADPQRLYRELESKGYVWNGTAWEQRQ